MFVSQNHTIQFLPKCDIFSDKLLIHIVVDVCDPVIVNERVRHRLVLPFAMLVQPWESCRKGLTMQPT
jgi:hypothetical protein